MSATTQAALPALKQGDEFTQRHLGPDFGQQRQMLEALGLGSTQALIEQTVPEAIRLSQPLALDSGKTEAQVLERLGQMAALNQVNKSYIGTGYYNCRVPNVILRNVMENPGWYTAYTPVPAGNLAGASGSAIELPADGHRSDRDGSGQRFAAR